MKYLFLTALLVLSSFVVSAQRCYRVTYEMKQNFGEIKNYVSSLYVSGDKCIFYYRQEKNTTIKTTTGDGENQSVSHKVIEGQPDDFYVYYDRTKDTIIQNVPSFNRTEEGQRFIVDRFPGIDWDINLKISREIGNLNCYLATGSYAGRSYSAWFSYGLGLKFGPYKFHGLPGVVVELEDDKGEVYFKLMDIREELCQPVLSPILEEAVVMKEKDYFMYLQKHANDIFQRVALKADKSLKVSVKAKVQSIEIYENN